MTSYGVMGLGKTKAGNRFSFEIRRRPDGTSCVVISSVSAHGHVSRMTVEDSEWPAFAEGFSEAAEAMAVGQLRREACLL